MSRTFLLIFSLFFVFITLIIPIGYSQLPTPPPTQAVPEGNIYTAVALVGTGLYLLWLRERNRE